MHDDASNYYKLHRIPMLLAMASSTGLLSRWMGHWQRAPPCTMFLALHSACSGFMEEELSDEPSAQVCCCNGTIPIVIQDLSVKVGTLPAVKKCTSSRNG